jgi:hypothetical protein
MLGDVLGPVIVAVVTTVGAIAATWLAARRLSSLGLGDAQSQVNKSLRELAETEKAKRELLGEERAREHEAWAAERLAAAQALSAMTSDRDAYRREADDCDRRLNNAYAEMRATGRLTDRRSVPRGADEEGTSS